MEDYSQCTYFNENSNKPPPTDHAKDRKNEGRTDGHRDVGDPNKVEEKGKKYTDSETGHTVHVDGNRVVITDASGRRVTQFKNSRKNTLDRIRKEKWIPK